MDDPDVVSALTALGVDEHEARAAVAEERVPLVLITRALEQERRYDVEEVARRAGVPPEFLRQVDRVLGLPPDIGFTAIDLAEIRTFAGFLNQVDPDALLHTMRRDVHALTTIAFSNLQLIRDQVVLPLRRAGASDVSLAVTLEELGRTLLPLAGPLMGMLYRRVLAWLLSTQLVALGTRDAAQQIAVAVGFVDVTGYTSLSARIDPSGLDEVLETFETRCTEVVRRSSGLRLVKFLGDAAMFVAVEEQLLAGALLEIVADIEAAEPLAGTPVHGGMAAGLVLLRGGDYFGPPVNVAARLTDQARAGTVLAAEAMAPALEGSFTLRRVPAMTLRGVGRTRPFAVRLLEG